VWVDDAIPETKKGIRDINIPIIFHSQGNESNSISQEDHGDRLLGQHKCDSCSFA
jgi:hypothetical protein